jgi:hypothetical protein
MMPAYLLREYKSISYYSAIFTAFSVCAIIVICSYDCILIHNDPSKSTINLKLFDIAAFPLFLGQTMVIFEANTSLLNLYSEH